MKYESISRDCWFIKCREADAVKCDFEMGYEWYNKLMIITKTDPYTKGEIEELKEVFDVYIKTVIDIEKKVCSAGASRHFESEKILLDQGSKQADLWGGGIDLETKVVDYNSFINIRPLDNNRDRYIQDPNVQKKFKQISEYFFRKLYE